MRDLHTLEDFFLSSILHYSSERDVHILEVMPIDAWNGKPELNLVCRNLGSKVLYKTFGQSHNAPALNHISYDKGYFYNIEQLFLHF